MSPNWEIKAQPPQPDNFYKHENFQMFVYIISRAYILAPSCVIKFESQRRSVFLISFLGPKLPEYIKIKTWQLTLLTLKHDLKSFNEENNYESKLLVLEIFI